MSDTKVSPTYKMRQRPTLQQCPICFDHFSQSTIISHADLCCRRQQIEGESKKKGCISQKKKPKKQNKNSKNEEEPNFFLQATDDTATDNKTTDNKATDNKATDNTTENNNEHIILKQEPIENKIPNGSHSSQIKEKESKQNENNEAEQIIQKVAINLHLEENKSENKTIPFDSITNHTARFDTNPPESIMNSTLNTNFENSILNHEQNNSKSQNPANLKFEVVECEERHQNQTHKEQKSEKANINVTILTNDEKQENQKLKKRNNHELEKNKDQKNQSQKMKNEQSKDNSEVLPQNKKRKIEKKILNNLCVNPSHHMQDSNSNHQNCDFLAKTPISEVPTPASPKPSLKAKKGEKETIDFNKNSNDSNTENCDFLVMSNSNQQKQAIEDNKSQHNIQQDMTRAKNLLKKLKERLNSYQVSQLLDVIASAKWYHLNDNNSHEKIHQEVIFHFKELLSNDDSLVMEFNFFYHGFLGWLDTKMNQANQLLPSNIENEVQPIPSPESNISTQHQSFPGNIISTPEVSLSYSTNTTINIQGERLSRSRTRVTGNQQNPSFEIPISYSSFQQINHPRRVSPDIFENNYYYSKGNHLNLGDKFLISNNQPHQSVNITPQQSWKTTNDETVVNDQYLTQLPHFFDRNSQLLAFSAQSQCPNRIIEPSTKIFPNSRNFELNTNVFPQIHQNSYRNMFSNCISQNSINQPTEQSNWRQQNRTIMVSNFLNKSNHQIQPSPTFNFNPNLMNSSEPIQTPTTRSDENRPNNFKFTQYSNPSYKSEGKKFEYM